MKPRIPTITLVSVIIVLATFAIVPTSSQASSLVSETPPNAIWFHEACFSQLPKLEELIPVLTSDEHHEIVGVCMPDGSVLNVSHQPPGNPGFISSEPEALTLFSTAERYDTIGFLAHNDLAGQHILDLKVNQDVQLIYDDGSVWRFRINSIQSYQALLPSSPHSDFISLNDSSITLSSTELFHEIYTAKGQVTFQTCIARDGQMDWGRLFVTARPLEDPRHWQVLPMNAPWIDIWGIYTQSLSGDPMASARE